jgi:hypothetical protein
MFPPYVAYSRKRSCAESFSISARGVLKAHADKTRCVWGADSFCGLPPPDAEHYPHDRGLNLHIYPMLSVSEETVRGNFARYGLLDDRVRFLKGWFCDTLPSAPMERLTVPARRQPVRVDDGRTERALRAAVRPAASSSSTTTRSPRVARPSRTFARAPRDHWIRSSPSTTRASTGKRRERTSHLSHRFSDFILLFFSLHLSLSPVTIPFAVLFGRAPMTDSST